MANYADFIKSQKAKGVSAWVIERKLTKKRARDAKLAKAKKEGNLAEVRAELRAVSAKKLKDVQKRQVAASAKAKQEMGGFDEREAAHQLATAAQQSRGTNRVDSKLAPYIGKGRDAGQSITAQSQIDQAKSLLPGMEEGRRQSQDRLKSQLGVDRLGSGSPFTTDESTLAEAKASGMMLNGLPVIQDEGGNLRYDIQKMGTEMGLTPDQLQTIKSTNFGTRDVRGASNRLDDLGPNRTFGGGKGDNETMRQAKWNKAGKAVGGPKMAMLQNLSQISPNEKIDFSKEDVQLNLQKPGYLSDLGRGKNIKSYLNENQGPTGIGKYAGVAMPALVGGLISVASAGATSPFVSAAVAGASGAMQGAIKGETSLSGIMKNAGMGAATSFAGSALKAAGSGALEGFKGTSNALNAIDSGALSADAAQSAAALGTGGGFSGAWEGLKSGLSDFGSSLKTLEDFSTATSGGLAEQLGRELSPAQQVNQWGSTFGGDVVPGSGGLVQPSGIHSQGFVPQGATGQGDITGAILPSAIQTPEQVTGGAELIGSNTGGGNVDFMGNVISDSPIKSPFEQLTADPNISPEENLSRQVTGVNTPGVSDPLVTSGVNAPTPTLDEMGKATGGIGTNPVQEYYQPNLTDAATILGGVGSAMLPLLSGKGQDFSGEEEEQQGPAQMGFMNSGMGQEDPMSQLQIRGTGY